MPRLPAWTPQRRRRPELRILHAERCTLETLVAAHAPEMFAVLSDPAIYEFENEPPPSMQWLAQRYARLESRRSADGAQQWLNWAVRLPDGPLAGYVQATLLPPGTSYVAYELASRYWRQGIGSSAVRAMLAELGTRYGVRTCVAVLKSTNYRSLGLLRSLGFSAGSREQRAEYRAEVDERVMVKVMASATGAA